MTVNNKSLVEYSAYPNRTQAKVGTWGRCYRYCFSYRTLDLAPRPMTLAFPRGSRGHKVKGGEARRGRCIYRALPSHLTWTVTMYTFWNVVNFIFQTVTWCAAIVMLIACVVRAINLGF